MRIERRPPFDNDGDKESGGTDSLGEEGDGGEDGGDDGGGNAGPDGDWYGSYRGLTMCWMRGVDARKEELDDGAAKDAAHDR
mgnify:CR=1 FL=1